MRKNFFIIGMGFIYPRHKLAIEKNGGKVIMTVDIDPSKNPDFLDYKEALESDKFKEVDFISICTPNHLHKSMIKDCLATGKPVLCEKPTIIDNDFSDIDDVKNVLQLRYHDLIPKIKQKLTNNNQIELIMKVYRDDHWWQSWRGDEEKSGGILIGLGVHMIDFLIYLLGDQYEIIKSYNSRTLCTGEIKFTTASVKYHVEVLPTRDGQTRKFIINGESFELCTADNLSFSGYHENVYKDFLLGRGLPISEAKKSIELILKLKNK